MAITDTTATQRPPFAYDPSVGALATPPVGGGTEGAATAAPSKQITAFTNEPASSGASAEERLRIAAQRARGAQPAAPADAAPANAAAPANPTTPPNPANAANQAHAGATGLGTPPPAEKKASVADLLKRIKESMNIAIGGGAVTDVGGISKIAQWAQLGVDSVQKVLEDALKNDGELDPATVEFVSNQSKLYERVLAAMQKIDQSKDNMIQRTLQRQ